MAEVAYSSIPGLGATPVASDFQRSCSLYNSLPDDSKQPEVSPNHLKDLGALFRKHGVEKKLGLHLVHGHFAIPENTVMVGKNISTPSGHWTKPTKIDSIEAKNVHGHIFVLCGKNEFVAYEYREGPPSDLSGISSKFFSELVDYLTVNNLQTLLGFQVLDCESCDQMYEFILDEGKGTVMLKAEEVHCGDPYRTTGWTFYDGAPSDGEKHAPTVRGTHQVFTKWKEINDVPTLRLILKDNGLI